MKIVKNSHRGVGFGDFPSDVSTDSQAVFHLLKACPVYEETALAEASDLAQELGVGALYCKDERQRMKLGSFKALGAAFVIAKRAYERIGDDVFDRQKAATALQGETFTTASAGNHGLSLAAAARIFGAKAVIFLSRQVPNAFADSLRALSADTVIDGDDYEASLAAAAQAAKENDWILLSDSTWEGYDLGGEVMQGYTAMAAEIIAQMTQMTRQPTHVFLQAGVGGLAAAVAVYLRKSWGEDFTIVIAEPAKAPALQASIEAGKATVGTSQESDNTASNMGRLDCKEPSLLALKALSKAADYFVTLSDSACLKAIKALEAENLQTSPSGGAGFAVAKLIAEDNEARRTIGLNDKSVILCILSEKAHA